MNTSSATSSEQDGPPGAKRRDFFHKAQNGMWDDRRLNKVKVRLGLRRPDVHGFWSLLQECAQAIGDGGRFEVDAEYFSERLELPLQTIAQLLEAFAAPDVALVVDGRLTTFIEKSYASERGARYDASERRKAQRAKAEAKREAEKPKPGARSPKPPIACERETRAQESDARASDSVSESDAQASDSAPIESSSELKRDSTELPSVVVSLPLRERDDDEILISRIKRAVGAKCAERTIRAGLPTVRSWLAEGCDLEADVLPGLADVARHLSRPLGTFQAPFLSLQVRANRDGRLAAQKARKGRGELASAAAAEASCGPEPVAAALARAGPPPLGARLSGVATTQMHISEFLEQHEQPHRK